MITTDQIRMAQVILNKHGNAGIDADGLLGPATLKATTTIGISPHWNNDRKIIGTIQYGADKEGIDAGPLDGYWGPQTAYAYEVMWGASSNWRDSEREPVETEGPFPTQRESDLTNYYGAPGTNQGKVATPYPLKIAWDTGSVVNRFTCHEKLVDPIGRVLERVQDHYGDDISSLGLDLWGGCFNKRKMRGGTKWSTHSWGIAIDWDPSNNQLKWKDDRASFANPVYNKWWALWEEEGFVSLGRAKNYDWMHVQAATV